MIHTITQDSPTIIIMLNKNTWGVKKCQAKKNQQLKALISNEAKKSANKSDIS